MRVILHFGLWLTCLFQFSQGINNPAQLKFTSYNTFLFSSSSARTWRRRCFSLWKGRCRAPQAATAAEPATCLPRSWGRASWLSNETAGTDDDFCSRGRTRGAGEAFGYLFIVFWKSLSPSSMGNALKPLWASRDFRVQGCHTQFLTAQTIRL